MNSPVVPRFLTDAARPEDRLEDAAAEPAASGAAPLRAPARYDSHRLFGASVEVEIVHQQQVYRLRRTAQGKLILTK